MQVEPIEPEIKDAVKAAGTSEGVRKGWLKRKRFDAHGDGTHPTTHGTHVTEWENGDLGYQELVLKHQALMEEHDEEGAHEVNKHIVEKGGAAVKAKEITLPVDAVHCRDSAAPITAPADWKQDEPVRFQYMPAGKHTIHAGFRKGSVRMTVLCDAESAKAAQSSFDWWKSVRPKRDLFGCVEHREQEASVRAVGFAWNDGNDGKDPGVYLNALPTSLGVQHVNGRVFNAWSPSFHTDAEYAKASCSGCRENADKCDCGEGSRLVIPEGARGSESNPARIVGVDFCVGTLTNKPAFRAIAPVKAKDQEDETDTVEAVWSDEARKASAEARAKGYHAANLSVEASAASRHALRERTPEAHEKAQRAHEAASMEHEKAMKSHVKDSSDADYHENKAHNHAKDAAWHNSEKEHIAEIRTPSTASEPAEPTPLDLLRESVKAQDEALNALRWKAIGLQPPPN